MDEGLDGVEVVDDGLDVEDGFDVADEGFEDEEADELHPNPV